MVTLKRVTAETYRLEIKEKGRVVFLKDIDWGEMARLFCQVAGAVCQQINKGK